MLFKSNKFFGLKSKRNISETSYPEIDITENICDHIVEQWQLSINLCQFFNLLLYVTSNSYYFLRFNYLKMCYFLVYLHICETEEHNCTETAIFAHFASQTLEMFCGRHIFSLFLTKNLELAQFLLFCNGTFTILMVNFFM